MSAGGVIAKTAVRFLKRTGALQQLASEFRNEADFNELLREIALANQSASGQVVNADTAMRIAAVNSCVRLISENFASLPLHVMRRMEGGGSRKDRGHPLYDLLYKKPNSWQTGFEFREMMQHHLLLRGNAYAFKSRVFDVRSGREEIRELIPMHPDKVDVVQNPDYSLSYTYYTDKGPIPLTQDDVFHLRGLSSDGVTGRSVIEDARNTFGNALGGDEYAGRTYANDATPSVVLTYPGKLKDEKVVERLRDTWHQTFGGSKNARKTAILEEGMKIEKLSMTAEEAQFLESRKFTRGEIAGLYRVPPHMIGDTEKSTSWGSGIEQQSLGFVIYTLRPWIVRWEQRLHRDLFVAPIRYFPQFNVEGLLRGDIKTRYEAYQIGIGWSILSPNEARDKENMNPYVGGDRRYRQANVVPVDADFPTPAGARAESGGFAEILDNLSPEDAEQLREKLMDVVHAWTQNGHSRNGAEHALSD